MSADQSARQITVGETGDHFPDEQAGTSDTQLRRRIRELAADLVRDVLDTIAMASAAEVGQLILASEQHRDDAMDAAGPVRNDSWFETGDQIPLKRRVRGRSIETAGDRHMAPQGDDDEGAMKAPPAPDDPFDITSPGELLASTEELRRETEPSPSNEAPFEPASSALLEPRPADSATALVEGDREASSERRPKVVLRAGESLLSATGSGVVIRRERRLPAPPR